MILTDGATIRMLTSYGKMSGGSYLEHDDGDHTDTTITFSNTFVGDADEDDDDAARAMWMSLALLLGLAAFFTN
jgi:hypothetical protein